VTPSRRSELLTWLGFAAFYSALTLTYAWPLVSSLSSAFPNDPGDPALTTWMVWWNTQALPLTERWWNAPIFFPVKGAFALSETLLALAPVTTPLQWLGMNPLGAHNIAFLLSYPACALAGHALAYRLTGRHDAALLAGLVSGFNPNRASQLPHVQVLWSMWMPAGLLALHRYLDTHRRRFLVFAAVAWIFNALSSGYFLVFFGVLMGFWWLWFPRTVRERVAIAAALAVGTLVVLPIFLGHHRYQAALGLARDADEIETFSADLSAYWATSTEPALSHHWTIDPKPEGAFYPGAVIFALAVLGAAFAWFRAKKAKAGRLQIALGAIGALLAVASIAAYVAGGWRTFMLGVEISLTRPGKTLFTSLLLLAGAAALDARARAAWRNRSPLVFYAFGVVAMVLFSLGPVGRVNGVKFLYDAPYSWLMMLPGASGMRVPARFGVVALLCLAQAGALGYARLTRRTASSAIVGCLLGAMVLAEGWVPRFPIAPLTLAEGVRPGGEISTPVLELPMTDPYNDVAAMLRGMSHRHPVVNGFSGYSPAHYLPLQEALANGDPAAFDSLTRFGPLLVVVDRSRDPGEEGREYVGSIPGSQQLYQAPLGAVYRLPATPAAAVSTDPELPIAYADSNQNFDAIRFLLDRNLTTWWQTEETQSGGDQITIGFPSRVELTRVDLDMSTSTYDYPRKLRVETADPGQPSIVLWEGRTAPLAMLGALSDFRRAPVSVYLPPGHPAQRFNLLTMERDRNRRWSIAEVRAFGRVR
jgi:hypothetical protein